MPGCRESKYAGKEVKETTFLFLYTNDEHGHFYQRGGNYKAAALYEMWEEEKKECPGCKVFKLSGGDNYTGYVGSSMFYGHSMAEIMNLIGYQVSAVGNHEFDFGLKAFKRNMILSKIKYISSNIIFSDFRNVFEPAVVFESLDGNVAFVGATTEDLKQVSFAKYIVDAKVVKPDRAVGRRLRELEKFNDILVVVAHDSYESTLNWVSSLEIKPTIVFNAHSHEEIVKNHEGVLFVQAGKNLDTYARVVVVKKGREVRVLKADLIPLKEKADFNLKGSKKIKTLTDKYLKTVEKRAGMKLILAKKDFKAKDFQKLYACSLLKDHPDFDVAMSNPGGFRDTIVKGAVKKSDIISILPFNNRIVLAEVSGSALVYNLDLTEESYCGVKKMEGKWFKEGVEIKKDGVYKVVAHEYIFGGGDYFKFDSEVGDSNITSKDWRTPVEKYLYESSKKGLCIEKAFEQLMIKYDR